MIISGNSASSWRNFAEHLMKTEEGRQRVTLKEIRGLAGETVVEAFRELEMLGDGVRSRKFYYHANIDPRADEPMTEEQWEQAVDLLEENLGLTGQERFIVEHDKNGRVHRHVIWSRVDTDTMTVVRDSHNYDIHMRTADALEERFGHERTERGRGPDGPNPKNYEVRRGKETGIDPKQVKAELTELWRQCDTGQAFAAALADRGYILAKGDRRDFVLIDQAGDDHALGQKKIGAKAAEVRARMADIDRDALPSVAEARKLARERTAQRGKDAPDAPLREVAPDPEPGTKGPGGAERELHVPDERPEPDHGTRPRPERSIEPGPSPTARLGAFDRVVAHWKEAYRKAVGDGSFIAEGVDWLARKLGLGSGPSSPPDREATAFDRVAAETIEALRENGGEPYSPDGTSFWQRAAATLRETAERAVSWVKDRVDDFVGRLTRERQPRPEHEHDFER